MDTSNAVAQLAALAQENRLAVFRHLVQMGPEGATPGQLAKQLGIPSPTLSFHLKTLQHARLVAPERSGRSIRYRADFAAMRALLDFLTRNCCGGDMRRCAPEAAVAGASRVRRRRP